MSNNELSINLKEFNNGMKIFKVGIERKNAKKKPAPLPAMLSCKDGFLSIESDDKLMVVKANGEWHGKAQFSHSTIMALTLVPLTTDPVVIKYEEGKISIATMRVSCEWEQFSQNMMDKLINPTLLDVLAMWKTLPAVELRANGIDKQHKLAQEKLFKFTASASKKLEDFEVTQEELLTLIEAKLKVKISK